MLNSCMPPFHIYIRPSSTIPPSPSHPIPIPFPFPFPFPCMLILMASQTTPATAFPHYSWPDPSEVASSSFSRASNLCRNRATSSTTTSTFMIMSYLCRGHAKAGRPKRRKPRMVRLGKARGQEGVVHGHDLKYYLSRLGSRGVMPSASYLAGKAKAFYSRIANNSGSPNSQSDQFMCVEPYFSMPVLPVTSTRQFV